MQFGQTLTIIYTYEKSNFLFFIAIPNNQLLSIIQLRTQPQPGRYAVPIYETNSLPKSLKISCKYKELINHLIVERDESKGPAKFH